METLRRIFNGVEDPRKSNATLHDFHEMLMISVFSSLCVGQTCVDMADFAKNNEEFLRRFMRLEHGPPPATTRSRGCSVCRIRSRVNRHATTSHLGA